MEKNEKKIEVETEPGEKLVEIEPGEKLVEIEPGEKLVEIGPIPYDQENPGNKYQLISVNGVTIMLERGKKHKVPERFADAYEYRVKMAGRRIQERERRAQELRERQNQDGVSFQ